MTEHARLVITAGEPAGIGPDVVLGALQSPFDAQIAVVGDVQVLEQRAIALGMTCSLPCYRSTQHHRCIPREK